MENLGAFVALIALASAAETEYGNLIGDFTGTIHDVSGTVYAVDERTFYIRGFSYDGTAPATVFYTGTTQDPALGGLSIPVPGSPNPDNLREYNLEDVMITIPDGRTIKDFRWLSVWCVTVGVSFGHVNIPSNLSTPSTKSLGSFGFSQRVHDVAADDVIILNSKQFKFINLDYDGQGPAAYFWTGGGRPDAGDIRVPHPPDQPNAILPRYSQETVTVTLQEGLSVEDVDFIGIWCVEARQNFGHISIQSSDITNIPPYIKPLTTPVPPSNGLDNCQVLLPDSFQISWTLDRPSNKIQMEFRGILSPNEYLAFGISGSPSSGTLMVGSDVTVVWFDPSTNEPKAKDYHLNQYSQCLPEQGVGACSDTLQGSEENVVLISGDLTNGVAVILIERPINSPDPLDLPIPTTEDVYVSWGIGFINPTGHVAKHDIIPSGDVRINFGQRISTCPPLQRVDAGGDKEPWHIPPLRPEGNATFTAVIGPSGGQKGYVGITGQVGWGLTWYINDTLIPEIHVKRGYTYTFIIYGGNDVRVSGNYHPFYITDDKDGGYAQKTDAQKALETIYAAPIEGDLCEYKVVDFVSEDEHPSFLSYASSLQLKCPANAVPGILEWTPDENTPDLVYYQCYQHRFFGWKIHVSEDASGGTSAGTTIAGTTTAGTTTAGTTTAGTTTAGTTTAGTTTAGTTTAGTTTAGTTTAGTTTAGTTSAGTTSIGTTSAGTASAGTTSAGTQMFFALLALCLQSFLFQN